MLRPIAIFSAIWHGSSLLHIYYAIDGFKIGNFWHPVI
jgi:hypothetical protein